MPTNIKRKIHKPPIYINDEVGCNKNYGNDASCYDETTVKVDFPNGNCCDGKAGDFVVTYPKGNCCEGVEDNSQIRIIFPNGNCCKETPRVKLTFPNGNCCKEVAGRVNLIFPDGTCCKEIKKAGITSINQRYDEEGNVYVWLDRAVKGNKDIPVTVRVTQFCSNHDEDIVFNSSSTEEIKLKTKVRCNTYQKGRSDGYSIKFITNDDRISKRNYAEQIDDGNQC